MQYVDLTIVRYAAMILEEAKKSGNLIACEAKAGEGICGEPATYLVPSAARAGGGGRDIERRPAMFCREHLEEMLGHPPEDQPIFDRIEGPETQL